MATGNDYRKVRALLAKTVAAGCTEGEAVSSLETALKLIDKYGLDRSRLEITVPEGWAIKDGRVEPAPKAEKPKRTRAAKAKAEAKPARKPKVPAEPKPPRVTNGERLAEMAARPEGFTIEEVMATFRVLEHTARAMVSIELRKKRGINIVGKKGRYTVAPAA